ncbi:MAG TPA: hypothetical protein DCG33_04995 [Prevotellaceae bacterium]|nr:hypothetical protein [Prevotellaceae bacterium]
MNALNLEIINSSSTKPHFLEIFIRRDYRSAGLAESVFCDRQHGSAFGSSLFNLLTQTDK